MEGGCAVRINMKKTILIITGIFLAVMLSIGGYYLYTIYSGNFKPSQPDVVKFPKNPVKGDPGYKEQKTVLKTGVNGPYSGEFVKVDGGRIFLGGTGSMIDLALNETDIAVQCTTQSLKNTTSIDLALVAEVKILNPDSLALIPAGETVVVFTAKTGEIEKAHTIAVSTSACLKLK